MKRTLVSRHRSVRIDLSPSEASFLSAVGEACGCGGGKNLSPEAVLRCMLRAMKTLGPDCSGIRCVEDLEKRFREALRAM